MIKAYLKQYRKGDPGAIGPGGPRWMIEVGYRDTLTPELLVKLCKDGFERWGITKTIVIWWFRDNANKAAFAVDMKVLIAHPVECLTDMAHAMVASANKRNMTHHLPLQFFGGTEPRTQADGKAAPYEESRIIGLDGKPLPKATG